MAFPSCGDWQILFSVTIPPVFKFLYKHFPKLYKSANSLLRILLDAIGSSDEKIGGNPEQSQISEVKKNLFLEDCSGLMLDRYGSMLGVNRLYNLTDNEYRDIIKILTYSRKAVRQAYERILDAIVGLYSQGFWEIYEINPSEVVVEIKDTGEGSNPGSLYLHADSGQTDWYGGYVWADATGDHSDDYSFYITTGAAMREALDYYLNKVKSAGTNIIITKKI